MKKLMSKSVLAFFVCASLLGATDSTASPIVQIDFGTLEIGTNWVSVVASGGGLLGVGDNLSNLQDFGTGSPTGITLAGSGFFGTGGDAASSFARDWVTANASQMVIEGNMNAAAQLSLGNLDPTREYRIEILANGSADTARISDFQVNSQFADLTAKGNGVPGMVGDNWRPNTDGFAQEDWMVWDAVSPSGTNITIDIVPNSGSIARINAIRIVAAAVPEPSSLLALLLLMGIPCGRRKRK